MPASANTGTWGTAPQWKRDHAGQSGATNPQGDASTNGVEHYYHVDHLGTSQRLTNAQGETTWRMVSEAFGKTFVDTTLAPTITSTTTNNFRFPGQYEDQETGTYYNYFRDYEPSTGRYVQSDPIGLAGGINTYGYVEGSPLSKIDPLGLWAVEFGGYLGVGGTLSFGRDPASGSGFMSLKLGKGLGANVSYDPLGGRAGGTDGQCGKGGVGAGFFAEAGGNFGPVAAKIEANLGRNFLSWFSSSQGYGGIQPKGSVDSKWGIGAGAAAGIELTVFDGGKDCTCKR
jgi:RHS repeat-associated protein